MRQPSAETQLRTARRNLRDEHGRRLEAELKLARVLTSVERLYRIISVSMGHLKDDDPSRADLKLWSDELAAIKRLGL